MKPSSAETIARLLQQLHKAMHRRLDGGSALELHALTILQVRTLTFLSEHPGSPMGLLTDEFGITKASVNALVNRLSRNGWLTRQRDTKDHRIIRLKLSTKAKRKMEQVQTQKQSIMEQALEALSVKDQQTFTRLLQTLTTHIHSTH